MSIVVNPYARPEDWRRALSDLLPDDEIVMWPELGDPADVEFVVAWVLPREVMAKFTSLRAILSVSAGAEQWLRDGVPEVPVVRLVDPALSDEMSAYALHWVVRLHRNFDVAAAQQASRMWDKISSAEAAQYRVGILGFGEIGSRVARAFLDLGYSVNAWSRTGRDDAAVDHFAGLDELSSFLANSDAVINVLPSTRATIGLLDAERLGSFKKGSVLVNIGRGDVLDETALIDALDAGPLRAAVLDVTDPEPPAGDSPLWLHPCVHLTPHVAGSTQVGSAAGVIVENIKRIRRGEEPVPLLDRTRGY